MTKIAKPIQPLLPPKSLLPLLPATKINHYLQILILQDPRRPLLIHRLRLPINKQLQFRTTINRPKAHARPLRNHRPLRNPLCIPDRAQDAPPIRILAVQRRLDQRRPRDRRRNHLRVSVRWRIAHAHHDEFRRAFAVAHDQLRERLREAGQDGLHGGVIWGGCGGDCLAACGAVGEEGDGVVGACVAIYGDGVEGAGDGMGQEGFQGGGTDGDVGAEDAEEGGHVRVDHAGAFGHAC